MAKRKSTKYLHLDSISIHETIFLLSIYSCSQFWVRWFIQFSALTVRVWYVCGLALGSKELERKVSCVCSVCTMHIHQQNIHSFKFSLFFIYLKFYTVCGTGYFLQILFNRTFLFYQCEWKFRLNPIFKVNEGDFLTTLEIIRPPHKKQETTIRC